MLNTKTESKLALRTGKLFVSMILCLAILLSIAGVSSAETLDTNLEEGVDIVAITNNDIENKNLDNADVIIVDYNNIDIIADSAKSIVDEGKMLYIHSPAISAEDLSVILDIPKVGVTKYNSEVLIAYAIYKMGDSYIFSNHYAVFATENVENRNTIQEDSNHYESIPEYEEDAPLVTADIPSNFNDAITLESIEDESFIAEISPVELAEIAYTAMEDTIITAMEIEQKQTDDTTKRENELNRSVTLPTKTATVTYNNVLNVYGSNNVKYGYINCTVYAYALGNANVSVGGGPVKSMRLYDVVSVAKAYPNAGYKVAQYKVRIHCNITGHTNLQTTSLPSGTSQSQSLSLSGSYSSSGGGGTVGYSTSWSYNPESQNITESSSTQNVVDWTAKPKSPTSGKAYDIAPGMRVANDPNYTRGAFSKIYCDAMILGITINSNSIEVGGWF